MKSWFFAYTLSTATPGRQLFQTLGLIAFMGVFIAGRANAQMFPNQSQSPGAILQSIQQNSPINQRFETPPSRPPKSEIKNLTDQVIPDTPYPDPNQTITIETIEVHNAFLVKPEEFQKVIAPYEHRTDTIGELETLTQKLKKVYADKGFSEDGVSLEPQTVHNGVVILRAYEKPVQ